MINEDIFMDNTNSDNNSLNNIWFLVNENKTEYSNIELFYKNKGKSIEYINELLEILSVMNLQKLTIFLNLYINNFEFITFDKSRILRIISKKLKFHIDLDESFFLKKNFKFFKTLKNSFQYLEIWYKISNINIFSDFNNFNNYKDIINLHYSNSKIKKWKSRELNFSYLNNLRKIHKNRNKR